jgi:hypothetical protein
MMALTKLMLALLQILIIIQEMMLVSPLTLMLNQESKQINRIHKVPKAQLAQQELPIRQSLKQRKKKQRRKQLQQNKLAKLRKKPKI